MASQQSSIDSMQEQITRMRDLIRSMTSGIVGIIAAAAAADADDRLLLNIAFFALKT